MKKFLPTLLSIVVVVALVFGIPGQSAAFLIGGQDIIAAPDSVADDAWQEGAYNELQQAFNERQGVKLFEDLQVDGGIIAAGTWVNSHMIFLNTHETQNPGTTDDFDVEWTFDGEILGVMSDSLGLLEAASNNILGASGTYYPGSYTARGMENVQDTYTLSSDLQTITVSMRVSEPGDWIRVVTRSNVPEPGTMLLLGLGLIGLAGLRRKLKK